MPLGNSDKILLESVGTRRIERKKKWEGDYIRDTHKKGAEVAEFMLNMGEEEAGEERKRRIKLFCPSVSKILQIIEREEEKLDLGFIARAFGLDPNSLKLNGHFISRGVDFIASSVTWKSLISFFSARGLSTGATDSDALLVHGKLSRIGSKRAHDLADPKNGIFTSKGQGYVRNGKKPQLECCNVLDKETESGSVDVSNQNAWYNGPKRLGLKRKLWLEDSSRLKRSRSNEAVSGCYQGFQEGKIGTPAGTRFFISENTKRKRENEMVAASPLKKIR